MKAVDPGRALVFLVFLLGNFVRCVFDKCGGTFLLYYYLCLYVCVYSRYELGMSQIRRKSKDSVEFIL